MRTDSALAGILIQETNSLGEITSGQFSGVGASIPTTASKFAVGCLITSSVDGKTYYNSGTVAAPTWNSVSDATVGEISLTTGSVLIGAAGVGSALDVKGSGKILVGNGTTATSVSVSGDATLASNGAVTIAAGAVTNAKVLDSSGVGALSVPKSAQVLYDFSVVGGAQGPIALTGSPTIPDNAVVWLESYDVITTCTSATDAATLKLSFETDGDITTALAISNGANPWDLGVFVVAQGALANPLPKKLTAARAPGLVVAGGENLTAGKIVFNLRYYVTL